jgi:adenosylhomocysteine nucleosidase
MSARDSDEIRTVCIIAAIEREITPLSQALEGASSQRILAWEFWRGRLADRIVMASHSGCGKVKAAALTQFMIVQYKPEYIVHYGAAGAISPGVQPGDIIVGEKSIETDYCELMLPDEPKPESIPDRDLIAKFTGRLDKAGLEYRQGIIACQDGDVVDRTVKRDLWTAYRGLCACWEGVAVGRICNLNQVPYIQLRGITDMADDREEATASFNSRIAGISKKLVEYIACGIQDRPL